jgi:hypothetical protein
MSEGLAEIVIVLDQSGSMHSIADDTIGGFNSFLKEQKEAPGQANLTLAQFDSNYKIVHDRVPVQDVPDLDFKAGTMTAMYDAIGRTIISTEQNIEGMEEKPDVVLFVVITDGMDNASREFGKSAIKEMIDEREKQDGWRFIFLGADIDSFAEGGGLGFKGGSVANFDKTGDGIKDSYASISKGLTTYRSSVSNIRASGISKKDADEEVIKEVTSLNLNNFFDQDIQGE